MAWSVLPGATCTNPRLRADSRCTRRRFQRSRRALNLKAELRSRPTRRYRWHARPRRMETQSGSAEQPIPITAARAHRARAASRTDSRVATHAAVHWAQIRNSFILAVNERWALDRRSACAHERVLSNAFCGNVRRERWRANACSCPLVIELTPAQQAIFSEIAEELAHNGFEAEPLARAASP